MQHPLLSYFDNSNMGATVSTTVSTTDPQYKVGLQILAYFHDESKKYSVYKPKSVDELLAAFGKSATGVSKGPLIAKGLGGVFKATQIGTLSGAQEAMIKLAKQSAGKIPTRLGFEEALVGKFGGISYLDIAKEAAIQTVEDAGTALVKVKNVTAATLENIGTAAKILPFVAIGLGAFIIYQKFGKKA